MSLYSYSKWLPLPLAVNTKLHSPVSRQLGDQKIKSRWVCFWKRKNLQFCLQVFLIRTCVSTEWDKATAKRHQRPSRVLYMWLHCRENFKWQGGKTSDSNVMWFGENEKLYTTVINPAKRCLRAQPQQLSDNATSNVATGALATWRWQCVQKPRGCEDTTPPFSTMAALMARRFLKSCLESGERRVWMFARILSCACKRDRCHFAVCWNSDNRALQIQFRKSEASIVLAEKST